MVNNGAYKSLTRRNIGLYPASNDVSDGFVAHSMITAF